MPRRGAPAAAASGTGIPDSVAEARAVPDDAEFDADSLVTSSLSPPQPQGRVRKKSRSDSVHSVEDQNFHTPRQSPAPTARRIVKVSSKFRAASAPRGAGRPPSPAAGRLVLRDHATVVPEQTDVQGRLAALEKQQALDHGFMGDIVAAVRGLNENFDRGYTRQKAMEEEMKGVNELDLQMRRQLAQLKGQIELEIGRAATVTAQAVEQRVSEIDKAIQHMQGILTGISEREQQMGEYLTNLHGVRPQEGQVVISSFQHVTDEILTVKERVKMFEERTQHHATPTTTTTPIFTEEMRVHLAKMHDQLLKINGEVEVVKTRVGGIEVKVQHHDDGDFVRGSLMAAFNGGAKCCGESSCGAPRRSAEASGAGGEDRGGGSASSGIERNPFGAADPPGLPGSSGDGGRTLAAVTSGNGECHCLHVTELQEKVARLEARGRGAGHGRDEDGQPPPDFWARPGREDARLPRHSPEAPRAPRRLPLQLRGPLGAIGYKDRGILDEKLALQSEFRFDGVKGGVQWKGKLERHIISRAPLLKDVLEWAEECDMETISQEKFMEAVRGSLTEEQVMNINAALWSFMSTALTGTAETIFKGAESLNGLDSWRRVTRYVNHGRSIHLERLRQEVKAIHLRPIKDLEHVEEGVAQFENLIKDYTEAGGTPFQDQELKSDLLHILPANLKVHLMWHCTDRNKDFRAFRDMIVTQSAQMMQNQQRPSVHAVMKPEEEHNNDEMDDNSDFNYSDLSNISTVGDLIAAFQRMNQRGRRPNPQANFRNRPGGGGQSGPGSQSGPGPSRRLSETRCPNCAGTHEGRCNRPKVEPRDRLCFFCNKPGHISKDCPNKKGIKAVTEASAESELNGFFMVENEGFQEVRRVRGRGAAPRVPTRPMPTQATLGDFVSKNSWSALGAPGPRWRTTPRPTTAWAKAAPSRPTTTAAAPRTVKNIIPMYPRPSQQLEADQQYPRPSQQLEADQHDAYDPFGVQGGMSLPADEAQSAETPPSRASLDSASPNGRWHQEPLEKLAACVKKDGHVNMLIDDEEELIAATNEKVRISVAMDSGSVDNVIHPKELPCDAEPVANTSGKHFVGANNSKIEKYGSCATKLESQHGAVGCDWQLADVTRPLHSVSKVTGPKEHPIGKQDVLFNNKKCVVVPPGTVERILKEIKPITEYERQGNLYLAEMTMSAFRRQGQVA